MLELLINYLTNLGLAPKYIDLVTQCYDFFLIFLFTLIGHYITKYHILGLIEKAVLKTKNKWDDLLQQEFVFNKIGALVPTIIVLSTTPLILPAEHTGGQVLLTIAKCTMGFQVANTIAALLNVVNHKYQARAQERYFPLNPAIQIIKLSVYLVATILAVSFIIGRSPMYLLSGLGALTAALMLVFQDTIKGFAASMQISANKMVAPGDWVELPNYGADGDVLEIGLTTVKVRNFDNTIVTVPTYALTSGSFKNWHGMLQSGGRRIKRSIIIDINSIKFYHPSDLQSLKCLQLLEPYIEQKINEITQESAEKQIEVGDINARQLTNIGTFRAYISLYLQQHPQVNHNLTCMVRQLPANNTGLPLELYLFSKDKRWVHYEAIQADIFDHLYAIAPLFQLRIFQHPSGHDWQQMGLKSST